MCVTLSIFLRTHRDIRTLYLPPHPVTRGPWHKDSKTWPTYLLLVTSILSCGSSAIVVFMYLQSVKSANRAVAKLSNLQYLLFISHVAVWIGTAIAYRRGKDGTDLWGWSCKDEAQKVIQLFFDDVVDFKLLCAIQVRGFASIFNDQFDLRYSNILQILWVHPLRQIQTSSWAVSLVQVILTTLNVATWWVSYRRYILTTHLPEQRPDGSQVQEKQSTPSVKQRLPEVFKVMLSRATIAGDLAS